MTATTYGSTRVNAFALVLCCMGVATAQAEWSRRSQWEATVDEQGLFRAYCILLVRPEQRIVTVSSTTERQDWAEWLLHGSQGADTRVTWVHAPDDGRTLTRYDHVSGECLPSLDGEALTFAKCGRTVASGEGVYPPGQRLIDELQTQPKIWTGLYARRKTELDTEACPATMGLAPYVLGVASLIDQAEMRVGDVLVKVWPWDYDGAVFNGYLSIGKAVKDRFLVGDPARIEYLRALPEGGWELVKKTLVWPVVPGMDKRPSQTLLQSEKRALEAQAAPSQALLGLMAAQAGKTADNADLLTRLARTEAVVDVYRLACFRTVHKHPFSMHEQAGELTDTIPQPSPGRVAKQIAWLDRAFLTNAPGTMAQPPAPTYAGRDLDAHLDFIEGVLEDAAQHAEAAFRRFSLDDRRFIEKQADGLMAGFLSAHMMCFDDDLVRQRANVKLLSMAKRLDTEALMRQALTTARIVDGTFLASLKEQMEQTPDARRIADRKTPWGRIVLAGRGDDRYINKKDNVAVLVDLGGDDFYANNTGSAIPGALATAVLIDFAGDDRYENWHSMRQGCGFFGVGILVDCGGNDSYVGVRCAQGTGFMGVGVLADLGGDDIYRGIDHCQGVGQFGAGLLLDDAGDNRYEGRQSCQGVGFTWGVGLLHSAGTDGDDEYFNKGKVGSGYGDLGSFEGWGQGLGCGHRPYASGGLGVLLDGGGSDRYEGGTFSLGGGYYYGLGILRDRDGHDRYRGSRYNMGFTAHQAVGVFIDDRGNDHYATSHFVAMGMAWDESSTLFLDGEGDDTYVAPGFAFAAGAMNGFALFEDSAGADHYVGVRPASKYGNRYHDGTSVGLFMDLGDGEDVFSGGRQAGEIDAGPEHTFFVDAPTVEAATERLKVTPLKKAAQ
ncbi:MAG: hypothetical protein HN742_12345 [Lentisphaerae bacterium]|nr:hypothetical protein [Lentisphaerota bacterium]MBT4821926.1 hypothetical protein [Lentisphaerota bacterium]MBT5607216.1 hypothetical protein [Lentisphaerota bacterium]MBT7054241.1 hypothetical protein [Lentisphaerota bacterium]MBT7842658.1 hypothetical protein [Lentisphaerota bacterium]